MGPEVQERQFEGVHCKLAIQQLGPSVVVLRISGTDVGEFGNAPMRVLEDLLISSGPLALFIDAREVRGVSLAFISDCAEWLSNRRSDLQSITMVTGSPFIHVTAEFVRRFSALEGLMRICTDPGVFERALVDATLAQ